MLKIKDEITDDWHNISGYKCLPDTKFTDTENMLQIV